MLRHELLSTVKRYEEGEKLSDPLVVQIGPRKSYDLRDLTRIVIGDVRKHFWAYETLWEANRYWSVMMLHKHEIDVMPAGGPAPEWQHPYPKLSNFVSLLRGAHEVGSKLNGTVVVDSPGEFLDTTSPVNLPRLVVASAEYLGRHYEFAIVDGAHRGASLVARGTDELEVYYGARAG